MQGSKRAIFTVFLFRSGLALAAFLLAGGCFPSFKVERQPSSWPDPVLHLWRVEARQIDAWESDSPDDLPSKCAYWRDLATKAASDTRGVTAYTKRRAEAVCVAAEERAVRDAENEKELAAQEAALAETTKRELASGTCSDDNRRLFGEWALYLKDAMRMRFTRDRQAKLFTFAGHELAVVGESGTALQLSAGLGGELHLFAFGRRDVELEVVAGGSQVALTSPWEDQLTWRCEFDGTCTSHASPTRPDHSASQVVLTQAADTVAVRLKGSGCVLLVAFYGS
jgi:hypothetical protein